jgi:hypothetical protein
MVVVVRVVVVMAVVVRVVVGDRAHVFLLASISDEL